jgi:predicted small lipoprotein YifL
VTAQATRSTSARGARVSWVPALLVIAALLAGASLEGCGQKGQLYLPNQKKSKVPPTQQPQGTPQPATPPPGTTPAPANSPAPS